MRYLKLFFFLIILGLFFVFTIPLYPFLFFFRNRTRKSLNYIVTWTSTAWLKILGIKVRINGTLDKTKNYLIVANHLSYLDALIISSFLPSSFVTSLEVKSTSFLGHLTMLSGCLFVNRKDKSKINLEILGLRDALLKNINVTFFPEATSTDGTAVIRFRKPLFEASIASGKPILPITINYQEVSSNKVSDKNRDSVFWYGEMTFFPHFMNLLKQSEVITELVIHEPFTPELYPVFELAEKAHQIISNSYKPILQEMRPNEIIKV